MSESASIPVQPFRTHLYEPDELLGGFDAAVAGSYAHTHDFEVYRAYVQVGREMSDHIHAVARAIHDSSITDALRDFVTDHELVGVMGGHRMRRSADPASPYGQVVRLARRLVHEGLTPTSGGGPGAMEATHLGARTAALGWSEVAGHLETLAAVPDFPDGIHHLVDAGGEPDADALARLHAWQVPAFAVAAATTDGPGESLGVPTWHYGHEPPTPLATHVAKYFQNSVREHGLLAIAHRGIVFFPGAAGTVQEIFQDAGQNYYGLHGLVSPMVFVGVEQWTRTLPAWPLLTALFDDHELLHLTDDVDDAADFLVAHPPRAWDG